MKKCSDLDLRFIKGSLVVLFFVAMLSLLVQVPAVLAPIPIRPAATEIILFTVIAFSFFCVEFLVEREAKKAARRPAVTEAEFMAHMPYRPIPPAEGRYTVFGH